MWNKIGIFFAAITLAAAGVVACDSASAQCVGAAPMEQTFTLTMVSRGSGGAPSGGNSGAHSSPGASHSSGGASRANTPAPANSGAKPNSGGVPRSNTPAPVNSGANKAGNSAPVNSGARVSNTQIHVSAGIPGGTYRNGQPVAGTGFYHGPRVTVHRIGSSYNYNGTTYVYHPASFWLVQRLDPYNPYDQRNETNPYSPYFGMRLTVPCR